MFKFENIAKKLKGVSKKKALIMAGLAAGGVADAQQANKINTGDLGGRAPNNPDFHAMVEKNPDDQKIKLLNHYKAAGIVPTGMTQEEFEKKYRNRDNDPTFNNWANNYRDYLEGKVERMPGSYVVKEFKRIPIITLSESQKNEIENQTANIDLLPFNEAFAWAEARGMSVFRWNAGKSGGGDFAVTHNKEDIEGTTTGIRPQDPNSTTAVAGASKKEWDERVAPRSQKL